MNEERIAAFIRSLDGPEDELLQTMREEAEASAVPVVRPETEALLSFFTDLVKPERILEVGCAVGYSAVVMAKRMPENGILHTIENYPPRIEKAHENFRRAGLSERITLFEGDASEILKTLTGPYDLIFMDAAKAQYIVWLPEILRLLSLGGVLISDNVLQEGDILESRFAIERRNRTIYKRMREYLLVLKQDPRLSSCVLPLGDGVALTTFRGEKDEETGASGTCE